MKTRILPLVILAGLLAAPTALLAEQPGNPGARAEQLAREGLDRFMQALEAAIEWVPQYEMPEVLENGDIIIRRKPPSHDSKDLPDEGTTRT